MHEKTDNDIIVHDTDRATIYVQYDDLSFSATTLAIIQ